MNILKSYAFWAVVLLVISMTSFIVAGFLVGAAYHVAYPGFVAISIACLAASLVVGSE